MTELVFVVTNEGKQTIYQYLLHEQAFSKRLLKQLQYHGEVWQQGKQQRLKAPLQPGELRLILATEQRSRSLTPSNQPLDICYEDDLYLIVNKPAGLLSIPSWQQNDDSLIQRVLTYYDTQGLQGVTAHIVTRLDSGTMGLVLIAKNHYAKQQLHHQKITRRYYASVLGNLAEASGDISWPIRRATGTKRECHPTGQAARTYYQVKGRGAEGDLLELELTTGRTHQIRVHLATLGHPLLGDALYGRGRADEYPYLQSYYLAFRHPLTKKMIEISLPLEGKLREACKLVR